MKLVTDENGTQAEPPKRGRPTDYCLETATEICRRLADGESLRAICKFKQMPDKETVRRWLGNNLEFRAQYARARQDQADSLIDEAMDEARGCATPADAAVARVKIDAYFRLAGKLKPKAYGDKLEHEHGGTVRHDHAGDLSRLSDDDLLALRSLKLKSLGVN